MNIVKSACLATILAVPAATANAAVIYATSVDSYTQGTTTRITGFDPMRAVTANALGAPDGKMLSLGFGGEAILSFGTVFTGPGNIVEITFVNAITGALAYLEEVQVFLGVGGVFSYLTNLKNTTAVTGAPFAFSGTFDQIKLVDVSPTGRSRDGFDIDSVSVTAIPVPAAGLLLLSAIGGFAMLRRRTA